MISEYKLPQTNTSNINTESQGRQIQTHNHTFISVIVIVAYHKLRKY